MGSAEGSPVMFTVWPSYKYTVLETNDGADSSPHGVTHV